MTLRWRLALQLLAEAAVAPADPADACRVPELEDGAADGHVGVGWEVPPARRFPSGHDRAERFADEEVIETRRAAVPMERGVVDRAIAGVHHGHADVDPFWFVVV